MTGMDASPLLQEPSLFPLRLNAHDLGVSRSGRRILDGLDLDLAPGQSILLRGQNGSGKTTLLRALAGFLPFDRGAITITRSDGAVIESEDRRAHTIYCGHADAVKGALSVHENMSFWARLYGAKTGTIATALCRFDLEPLADLPANILSAGQKRRLGLSRLLFCQKALWLLDEPTTSLDTKSVKSLVILINDHCKQGGGALIVTHDSLTIDGSTTLTLSEKGPIL